MPISSHLVVLWTDTLYRLPHDTVVVSAWHSSPYPSLPPPRVFPYFTVAKEPHISGLLAILKNQLLVCPFLIFNIPLCSLIHNAKHAALYEIRAPVLVVVGGRVVPAEGVEIHSSLLPDRVASELAAEAGAVEAPLIGDEARHAVAALRAEAERKRVGKRAG